MAGLANVYAVGRSAQKRKLDYVSFLPDWIEVMTDIQDCSNILTAICERWDDARSSCEIFSRLSTSAFKELMKVATHSQEADALLLQQSPFTNSNMQSTVDANMHYSSNAQVSQPGLVGQMQTFSPRRVQDENMVGFQDLFQDMQSILQGRAYSGPNEVMMGLDRDWFE
jgi:hypothetical protein